MNTDENERRKRRKLSQPESGPYVLRSVLEEIPLKADQGDGRVSITCVEYWNNNLYIGTSAAEILHLVALPADEDSNDSSPTYILASRLQPSGHGNTQDSLGRHGVKQILVLSEALKACVLCNGVVSFYSLPELSPAFPNREPAGVQWIGGLDENEKERGGSAEGSVVMIANSKRILLVRVGEKLRQIKNNIEYPGCLRSSRRDTIACVADNKSYALLDVELQQKIPLFPISSAPTTSETDSQDNSRRGSPQLPAEGASASSHGRSTSMGNLLGSPADQSGSPRPSPGIESALRPPAIDHGASLSASSAPPHRVNEQRRTVSRQRSSTDVLGTRPRPDLLPKPAASNLKPHIISPFPSEFMLTTGTSKNEAGVGMFVNFEGDVVRGTIEFASYPEAVTIDSFDSDDSVGQSGSDGRELVLALLKTRNGGTPGRSVQIQRLPGNEPSPHSWLSIPGASSDFESSGLCRVLSSLNFKFVKVFETLQSVPMKFDAQGNLSRYRRGEDDPRTSSAVEQVEQEQALFDSQTANSSSAQLSNDLIEKRQIEEKKFANRFGLAMTRNLVWQGERLWQILENPLLLQLESQISMAIPQDDLRDIKPKILVEILTVLRSREPRSETDFLTINYARQKVSLLLFLHLQTLLRSESDLADQQFPTENALHEGGLDPRIILLLIPPLATEVYQGTLGIWLPQGLADLTVGFKSPIAAFSDGPLQFWMMIRHYLTLWQEKRGYGSITDEKLVFDSVDAALLHVLLYLDSALPRGSGVQTSVRAKMKNVVDHWKGEFDRATALLERYHHLYVMSRLFQSKKQSKAVLHTWRRIVEGEKDVEYESNPEELEIQIKRYLILIRDPALVQEYGVWLAQRNPSLGVQIFADDSSRVKFTPQEVIPVLKEHAPGAVQQYLEYLVFGKHLENYADDLIGYYLDSVINVLETSEAARETLAQTYSTYRALTSPKPTYLNFISENAPSAPWWESRMRLLQLLGSGGYATSSAADKELTYSVPMVLERLAPFSSYLVSESIILDARQGRHKEALRLLTHGLGDYDTAVRYCYFGGPAPTSSGTIDASALPARTLQQDLFTALFNEFLSIEDIEERLERTSQLLGKFATWFDPLTILAAIPDDWNVAMLAEFLLRSFRAATSERNEAVIVKALSAAQNLQRQAEWVEVCEKIGARIEKEGGVEGGLEGGQEMNVVN